MLSMRLLASTNAMACRMLIKAVSTRFVEGFAVRRKSLLVRSHLCSMFISWFIASHGNLVTPMHRPVIHHMWYSQTSQCSFFTVSMQIKVRRQLRDGLLMTASKALLWEVVVMFFYGASLIIMGKRELKCSAKSFTS